MKVYCINLDRSPERLAHMRNLLAQLGIDFVRIPAVDGSQLPDDDIPDKTPFHPGTMTRGEMGCFLSHRHVWNLIADDADPLALVLEDDVRLSDRLPMLIGELDSAGKLPGDADILKLDTHRSETEVGRRLVPVCQGVSGRALWGTHWHTTGYVISRSAARRLSEIVSQHPIPADGIFRSDVMLLWRLQVMQCIPALVVEGRHSGSLHLDSTIDTEADPRLYVRKNSFWRQFAGRSALGAAHNGVYFVARQFLKLALPALTRIGALNRIIVPFDARHAVRTASRRRPRRRMTFRAHTLHAHRRVSSPTRTTANR